MVATHGREGKSSVCVEEGGGGRGEGEWPRQFVFVSWLSKILTVCLPLGMMQ